MQEKREIIEKEIYTLYGKSGKGVYEVALAEWKYETNETFESLLLATGTIPALDNADEYWRFLSHLLWTISTSLLKQTASNKRCQRFGCVLDRINPV